MLKLRLFLAASLVLLCIKLLQAQPVTVFRQVNVITMTDDKILRNTDVVVRGNEIVSVGKTGRISADIVIDGRGKYLIPGLSEMHAHVPPVDDLQPMVDVINLYVFNGITTIRGMLGHPRHLELRDKIQSGEITGPKFYTAGPSFSGTTVKSPEAGVIKVKEQKAAGYDFLKLHPGLTIDIFEAITRTAKEVGIPYGGHVAYQVGLKRAADARYEIMDHLDGITEAMVPGIAEIPEQEAGLFGMFLAPRADAGRLPEIMANLKRNGVALVPTQALAERWFAPAATPEVMDASAEMRYMDRKTRDAWMQAKRNLTGNALYKDQDIEQYIRLRRQQIMAAHQAGVLLLLGSDGPQVFNVPGFSVHHELQYLVDAGLTPYQALKTGTVNVAEFFRDNRSGQVRAGNRADLVLLNANPLDDIRNSRQIEGVMINGKWLDQQAITDGLKKLEK